MNIERARIAVELLRIAAELSPDEEMAQINGMTVSQLIDRLYHNKSNLVSIPRREKLKKYDKIIEFNDAYKNMTIQDVLRDIAKISVEEKTENGDKQV